MVERRNFTFNQLASGILIPLLVVVIGVGAYLILLPRYRALRDSQAVLAQQEQKVAATTASLDGMKRLIADFEAQKTELQRVDLALPESPEIPELLANLDFLASQSGVVLSSVQIVPAPTLASASAGQAAGGLRRVEQLRGKTKDLDILEVSLTAAGNYPNLKAFLLNLEQNLRLMDVQELVVAEPDEETGLQEYGIKLHTYYQK